MKKVKKLTPAQIEHQKYLKKMGVSKEQIKERKKTRPKPPSVFNTNYGKNYYDDKPTGGIVYDPVVRTVIGQGENETVAREIARKNNIALAMNEGGPRDLDYPEKVFPEGCILTRS